MIDEGKATTEDTIPPDEMSEEQLDEALAASQTEDAQSTQVETQTTPKTENEEVATTEQSLTKQVEQKETATTKESAQTGDTASEVDKLKKQLEEKELFIQRQGNELGELKKVVFAPPPIQAPKPIDPDELSQLDPVTAVEVVLAHKEQVRQYEMASQSHAQAQNKAFITSKIPDFEAKINDIADIARADGISEVAIENFKRNPWQESPITLLNLAHRANISKKLKAMETEIVTLKKKPSEVVGKIEAAAKLKPMTGTTGTGAAAKQPISIEQFDSMTEAEIDAELEKRNETKRR